MSEREDVYHLGEAFAYLGEGDIVRIDPDRGDMVVLYRRASAFNSMLVTERCDNYCVMCSQPPKPRADDWLIDELLKIIPWMSPDTGELGITGGEPALLGSRLLAVIERLGQCLPQTAVHVLTNGRAFADESFAPAPGMPVAAAEFAFEPTATGTRARFTTTYETTEALQQVLDMGMEEGITLATNQIDALLAEG